MIFFLRHGQTDWNVAGRLQGQTDIPLNETGRRQARANATILARHLATIGRAAEDFDYIASPLSRARETMELLRRGLGLAARGYRTDPRLMEVSFGQWEGRTYREIKAADPRTYRVRQADKWSYRPPAGESYAMLADRVRAWHEEIDDPSIVVSHGGVSRVLRGILADLPPARTLLLDVPQDRVMVITGRHFEWL